MKIFVNDLVILFEYFFKNFIAIVINQNQMIQFFLDFLQIIIIINFIINQKNLI